MDNQKDFIKRIFNLQIALTLVATLVLAEDLAPAADAEDAQLVAKKHEKRGLSSLGYSYEAPLGYNSNYNSIGYNRLVSPIAYSRGSLLTFGYISSYRLNIDDNFFQVEDTPTIPTVDITPDTIPDTTPDTLDWVTVTRPVDTPRDWEDTTQV